MMIVLKSWYLKIIAPVSQKQLWQDLLFLIPRIICGYLLAVNFGAPKFGMPWTDPEKNLALFEVAAWFPTDVEAFGGIFAIVPVFFAWMGAFSEAVGGIFLCLGLKTRIAAFLILCTMLVAIFGQKWGQGVWSMLPAMGFLWISIFYLVLGSGRFGVDYLIYKQLSKNE